MRIALAVPLCLMLLAGCAPGGPPAESAVPGTVSPPQRVWLPEGEPRARILAVHGFNDYAGAFDWFGSYAAEHGVAVYAYDQPGFGAQPDASLWPGTRYLVDTLHFQINTLAAEQPQVPLFLLGESMGGAVVTLAATEPPRPELAGVILVAPALWGEDPLGPFTRSLLFVVRRVAPDWQLTGENLDIKPTDNIEALRRLWADPLVIKGTRVDALGGLVDAVDAASAQVAVLPGPLLTLAGAKDGIVPPEADRGMRARLTAAPCTGIVYPEGYHLLLRDEQRQRVWDDILAWIDDEDPPSGLAEPCGGSVQLAGAPAEAG